MGMSQNKHIGKQELQEYAYRHGLDQIAEGRYSQLFVLNLMLLESDSSIDPYQVIDEIRTFSDQEKVREG